jgi:hypothetical protein
MDNEQSNIESLRFSGTLLVTYATNEFGFRSTIIEEVDFDGLKELVSTGCKIKHLNKLR